MYAHKMSHEYPYTPKSKIKRLSVSSIPGPLNFSTIITRGNKDVRCTLENGHTAAKSPGNSAPKQ